MGAPGRPRLPQTEKDQRAAARLRARANELAPMEGTAHSKPVVNRYDAAGYGRRISSWNPPASGPNRANEGSTKMRDRARDATRNDWSGEAIVTKWATTLVGIGVKVRFDNIASDSRRKAVTDAFNDWCKVADSDGALSYFALQTVAVRELFESGEVFGVLRTRPVSTRRRVPVVVQVIESDYCPYLDTTQWPGMPVGHYMRQGIEFDDNGERSAYWFWTQHPGDRMLNAPLPGQLVRIPAENVCHVFEAKRAGQVRGVSQLASILIRLRSTGDFEDVTLDRQKIANLFTMFVTRALPKDLDEALIDPDTGLPTWYDKDGAPVQTLQAGMSQELDPGSDVKFSNPPEAGTTYSDYIRTNHLGTAAGVGMPYELLSGDIRNVSDRTLRVVMQEFRRLAAQKQWQILIPMFCQRVVEAWGVAAVLAGIVRPGELDAVNRCTHAPHGFEYIHPVQDPQGKILEVQAGFRSRSDVIGEAGDDPIDVDNARQTDMLREKKLGLPDTTGVVTPTAPKPGSISTDHAGEGDDVVPPAAPGATSGLRDAFEVLGTALPGMLGAYKAAFPNAREPAAPAVIHNYGNTVRTRKVVDRDPVTGLVNAIDEVPIDEDETQ
jgi:lambda family phage portal protein